MEESEWKKRLFVAVHAGAGYHSPEKTAEYKKICRQACLKAMAVLLKKQSAVEAVTAAVSALEDSDSTNAGRGSSLTVSGGVECDACVMDGSASLFGAVGCLPGTLNPVKVAGRLLSAQKNTALSLGRIPPSVLVGQGAVEWARSQGFSCDHGDQLVTGKSCRLFKKYKRKLEHAENPILAKRACVEVSKVTYPEPEQNDIPQLHAAQTHPPGTSHFRKDIPQMGLAGNTVPLIGLSENVRHVESSTLSVAAGKSAPDLTDDCGMSLGQDVHTAEWTASEAIESHAARPQASFTYTDSNTNHICLAEKVRPYRRTSLSAVVDESSSAQTNTPAPFFPANSTPAMSLAERERTKRTTSSAFVDEFSSARTITPAPSFPEKNTLPAMSLAERERIVKWTASRTVVGESREGDSPSFPENSPPAMSLAERERTVKGTASSTVVGESREGHWVQVKGTVSSTAVGERREGDWVQVKGTASSTAVGESRDGDWVQAEDEDFVQDTVGAVCVDWEGHVSSAVSSGGIWLKQPGRLGPAAMYGAACWAQDARDERPGTAVIASGCGEHLMRTLLAKTCADCLLVAEDTSEGLQACLKKHFLESPLLTGVESRQAGLVAVVTTPTQHNYPDVEVCWAHTTDSMALGYMSGDCAAPKALISRLSEGCRSGRSFTLSGDFFSFPPSS